MYWNCQLGALALPVCNSASSPAKITRTCALFRCYSATNAHDHRFDVAGSTAEGGRASLVASPSLSAHRGPSAPDGLEPKSRRRRILSAAFPACCWSKIEAVEYKGGEADCRVLLVSGLCVGNGSLPQPYSLEPMRITEPSRQGCHCNRHLGWAFYPESPEESTGRGGGKSWCHGDF